MSKEFFELYRRPEWQRRRLEIMERDEFACAHCGDSKSTLNVHHAYYEKNAKPWEYPDHALRTLCESCHEKWHKQNKELKETLAKLGPDGFLQVLGYVRALLMNENATHETRYQVSIPVNSFEEACGICNVYGLVGIRVIEEVCHQADMEEGISHGLIQEIREAYFSPDLAPSGTLGLVM